MEEIIPGSIIVTGASGSMGKAAVKALALKGRSVTMACRNLQKGEAARREILARVPGAAIGLLPLDLASLRSVRAFAAAVKGSAPAGLLNNAGTMPCLALETACLLTFGNSSSGRSRRISDVIFIVTISFLICILWDVIQKANVDKKVVSFFKQHRWCLVAMLMTLMIVCILVIGKTIKDINEKDIGSTS